MLRNFVSQKYDDIYFNPADPESEKQYVFIEGSRIAERIVQADTFTVAELGFGFGLNCALTFHAAKKADCSHKLKYFSVEENFPPEDEIRTLAEDLKLCQAEFSSLWTLSLPSSLSIPLPEGEGRLYSPSPSGRGGQGVRVYHGSAADFLASATFLADVWYFDGFSPAKNPEMWSAEVFARAFALTRPGGSFSTYTSAGWVRRNLEAAGFMVKKVPGFGNKREMLTGFRPPNEVQSD